jgi:hypothetical protein
MVASWLSTEQKNMVHAAEYWLTSTSHTVTTTKLAPACSNIRSQF